MSDESHPFFGVSRRVMDYWVRHGLVARGLTKEQAAAYCGCETTAAFDSWVQRKIIPPAIPGTSRWDRHAIDAALDRLSGLVAATSAESEADRWFRENP
jgi:hypothetical protein